MLEGHINNQQSSVWLILHLKCKKKSILKHEIPRTFLILESTIWDMDSENFSSINVFHFIKPSVTVPLILIIINCSRSWSPSWWVVNQRVIILLLPLLRIPLHFHYNCASHPGDGNWKTHYKQVEQEDVCLRCSASGYPNKIELIHD